MKKKTSIRRVGRPAGGSPPVFPPEEVDRLLVHGEVVTCEDGESTTVSYPTYAELARRYKVSQTLIAKYSRDHNCMRRREQAKAQIKAKADKQLIELRATAIALSKDDELRIIDGYLAGFEKALAEGRVRFNNPADFNAMVRLKEFVLGGADSRQEIHASLSLDDIQARHQRMLKINHGADAHVRGEVGQVIDVEPEPAALPVEAPVESPDADGDGQVVVRAGTGVAGPGSGSRDDGWSGDRGNAESRDREFSDPPPAPFEEVLEK